MVLGFNPDGVYVAGGYSTWPRNVFLKPRTRGPQAIHSNDWQEYYILPIVREDFLSQLRPPLAVQLHLKGLCQFHQLLMRPLRYARGVRVRVRARKTGYFPLPLSEQISEVGGYGDWLEPILSGHGS